ncbi:MAG: inositol 2-dehydrogenase [Francisella sp.]
MAIKLALIGFGRIGRMHYDILKKNANFQVKYIVNIDLPDGTKEVDGIPIVHPDNLDTIINDIDAVVIAASTTSHASLIETIAPYGKDIFCEKPISFDIKCLQKIKDIVNKNNVKLQIGLNRRFDKDFALLQKYVKSGKVGNVHILKITNKDPQRPELKFVITSGGLFFDFNTHDFDMMRYLTGLEATEVFVMGDALSMPELKEYNDIDTAVIMIRLSNGGIVVIDTARETGYGYDQRIEVFGSKGMLSVDNLRESSIVEISGHNNIKEDKMYWSFVERYADAYKNEFQAFADYIKGDIKESPAGIDDMIESVKIAMAVEKSFKEHRPVKLEEIK